MKESISDASGEGGRDILKRRYGMEISTYIHEILLHVVGKVLEHSHLAHKVLGDLASGEDGTLAQLCIVMDGPAWTREGGKTRQTLVVCFCNQNMLIVLA